MTTTDATTPGTPLHIVTLVCKDAAHAARCLQALSQYGRPDALSYGAASYEFGLKEGSSDTVLLVERWDRWGDLDRLLAEKVVPALPLYNELLARPFDPAVDTLRVHLASS
jgi:hypothetical protein